MGIGHVRSLPNGDNQPLSCASCPYRGEAVHSGTITRHVRATGTQAGADADAVAMRTTSKQELQYTGRSLRGANGTIAC